MTTAGDERELNIIIIIIIIRTGVEPHDVGYGRKAVEDGDDLDDARGVLAVAEGEDGVNTPLVIGTVVGLSLLLLLLLKCSQDAFEGPRDTAVAVGAELIVLGMENSDDLEDVLGRDVEVQVAVWVEDAGVDEVQKMKVGMVRTYRSRNWRADEPEMRRPVWACKTRNATGSLKNFARKRLMLYAAGFHATSASDTTLHVHWRSAMSPGER
jgi:hypothetical protein